MALVESNRKESPDISYARKPDTALFTSLGRVFVAILENPDMKQWEVAKYLRIGESRVSKAISSLVQANLVVRTKVNGRNRFALHPNATKTHPDIVRFLKVTQDE